MGRFVEGEDRQQSLLLPDSLDDYVTQDNPVRVIEVFIDELDLGALGFAGVLPAATGRPAYHPQNLAWTLRALNPTDATAALRVQHMDLFGDRFLHAIGEGSLRDALEPFRVWYGDLKGRRDPAAHRIPLSVPPTVLDELAQQEYADLDRQHAAATAKALAATRRGLDDAPSQPLTLATAEEIGLLFGEAHALHAKRQKVGRFPGLFAHHPDEVLTV